MAVLNDDSLIAEYINGNEAAFEMLIDKYRTMVFSLLWRMLGSREAAEDGTQAVFVKVFKNIRKFKGNSSFKTWVYSIALNEGRSSLRKLKKAPIQHNDEIEIEDSSGTPENEILDSEEKALLFRAMRELSYKQRAVITMRLNEEVPFKEIAAALGITENAAKVNFQHGYKKLKTIIEEMAK